MVLMDNVARGEWMEEDVNGRERRMTDGNGVWVTQQMSASSGPAPCNLDHGALEEGVVVGAHTRKPMEPLRGPTVSHALDPVHQDTCRLHGRGGAGGPRILFISRAWCGVIIVGVFFFLLTPLGSLKLLLAMN